MTHLFAILGLAGGCILWFLVQRWSDDSDEPLCGKHGGDCKSCALEGEDCE